MAPAEDLSEKMQNINLDDRNAIPELIFHPRHGSIHETSLDTIPRYLFRVVSPRSNGMTNVNLALSNMAREQDIRENLPEHDIFYNFHDSEVQARNAIIVNAHLNEWRNVHSQDNFVSWTSSLLFAIQYIYYRHLWTEDRSDLADIKLFIIDTTRFTRGTFIRDLDLIGSFSKFNDSLRRFQRLRRGNKYYFGEYLSQGRLSIEGKCQMISADVLFEQHRLQRLQPHFHDPNLMRPSYNPEWANAVVRLRERIWAQHVIVLETEMNSRLAAMREIIDHFDDGWKAPMAIYFVALLGYPKVATVPGEGGGMMGLKAFGVDLFSDLDHNQERPQFETQIVAPQTMPELVKVDKLFQIWKCMSKLKVTYDELMQAIERGGNP
ncbi:hypothetical protein POX_h09667 [Penicillium oxalicum]|uniref:hypothetical protein n=1 Tax=Penicillium oxalicum TaxID=69781 RepID=UPI0020B8738F|nr:hypothetical protein POX_h09667 [Penicillium oxalicum]KAI2785905.1 hypothetical protein POX_h09667 [Penicillium oxalicum]